MICQKEIFQFYLCLLPKGLYIMDSQMVLSTIETLKNVKRCILYRAKDRKGITKTASALQISCYVFVIHTSHQVGCIAIVKVPHLVV